MADEGVAMLVLPDRNKTHAKVHRMDALQQRRQARSHQHAYTVQADTVAMLLSIHCVKEFADMNSVSQTPHRSTAFYSALIHISVHSFSLSSFLNMHRSGVQSGLSGSTMLIRICSTVLLSFRAAESFSHSCDSITRMAGLLAISRALPRLVRAISGSPRLPCIHWPHLPAS